MKTFFFIFLGLALSWPLHSQENTKVDAFIKADTQKARMLLRGFTTAELQKAFNQYKKDKPLSEQRMLWLIEEYHQREADRVAQSRLNYLFAAFLIYLTLIFGFVLFIFFKQKAMSSS